ncbi:MAG: NTP transferase domain-containing protein [Deltaproteobacteria bacterium]|nr:NTP transferase domain-containing protein [Deltaproteobacteria bacterium]
MTELPNRGDCCAIILAAGEGERLRPWLRQRLGETLPKQYVNLLGARSMLQRTFDRVEKLIPRERVFTVVSRSHLSFPAVQAQLAGQSERTVIAQPVNRDTGAGILLPLMHVAKRYPESLTAIFPSDHFIVEEDRFLEHVASAFRAVERHPSRLVLLGMEPHEPEREYGYILPEAARASESKVRRIVRFVEKPDTGTARGLISHGALWNTLVLVFQTRTLLGLVRRLVPGLHRSFERLMPAIGTQAEVEATESLYQRIPSVNFSRGLLEALPQARRPSLFVLPVRGVFWSDWGLPHCVEAALRKTGSLARLRKSVGTLEVRPFENLSGNLSWKRI